MSKFLPQKQHQLNRQLLTALDEAFDSEVEVQDFSKAKTLIQEGANVNAQDDGLKWTPLHYAVSAGDVDFVNMLLKAGAKPNIVNHHGYLPLSSLSSTVDNHYKIITALMKAGAKILDKQNQDALDDQLATAEQEKNHSLAVSLLIAGAKFPISTPTPLVYALKNTDLATVQTLLAEDFIIDALRAEGDTPLHMAVRYHRADLLAILLQAGADINAKDKDGYTPLEAAVRDGSSEKVLTLLDNNAEVKDTLSLHFATSLGRTDLLTILLHAGAYVNAKDKDGCTPLHEAVKSGKIDALRVLLSAGANPNFANNEGKKPIDIANSFDAASSVVNNSEASVALISYALEQANADLLQASASGNVESVRMCLERGADATTHDSVHTPIGAAVIRNHVEVVKLLLQAGVKVDTRIDAEDKSLLHLAVENRSEDLVKALLEAGANANSGNKDGLSPLHTAIEYGNIEIIRNLLDASADVSSLFYEKETPLAFGARMTTLTPAMVELLVQKGADANAKDLHGNAPLKLAERNGNEALISALKTAGAEYVVSDEDAAAEAQPNHGGGEIPEIGIPINDIAAGGAGAAHPHADVIGAEAVHPHADVIG